MSLIVQKFGGSSVADADRIRNVARIITETYRKGHSVVAVLSAQGDTTDDLIAKAQEINPKASRREMDMLLSTGEQISISLCAMAIEAMGYQAISLTGWQAGMSTDTHYSSARIRKINTERIQAELDKKKIVLVAGFQGINKWEDVTTLGRGGSDTSADEQAAADDTAARTTADESADTSATSDKQTAIDEFNATSAAFNEVANAINADPSAFDSEVIDTMQQMSDLLNQYQQMLSGDDEYTQEDLDKMTEWFGQVQDWVDQVKADLNIE